MEEIQMKAFASDFDRTLYFKDCFKKDDVEQIKTFQDKGYLFGVCTGRSLDGVLIPTSHLISYDFYILCTGSLILDKNKSIIDSHVISKETVESLTSEYGENYKLAYNCGDNLYSLFDDYEIFVSMKDISELPNKVYGISFVTEDVDSAYGICKYLNSKYELSAFNNGPFVDITAKGCSKGKAIKTLKEKLNIDEIYCMGDSFNDMTMLESGDVSFTFPTSPKLVQDKATFIKDSVSEALKTIK